MNNINISYLILANKNINKTINLISCINANDPTAHFYIHFDKSSNKELYHELHDFCIKKNNCYLYSAIRCSWGTYSLVEATLFLIDKSLSSSADYFYLLSESCYPITKSSIDNLKNFLLCNKKKSFIEIYSEDWITGGIRSDRYHYHHFFNFKKHPTIARIMYKMQKLILPKRQLPNPLRKIKFGSQWWCINRDLMLKITSFINYYPGVKRFFKSVWIPDECFFQTIVYHVEDKHFESFTLTYYKFDKNGKPETFIDQKDFIDKVDMREIKNKFFFRKID